MRDRLGINLHRDRWPTPPLLKAHEAAGSDLGAPGVDPVKLDLHLAPGRPYPVARSLLEAMAAGCVVLASDTEPHRQVITPGRTGLLVDGRHRLL